jgi:hypothetical protein
MAKSINTREIVAKSAGISHGTLSKIKYLRDNADKLAKGREKISETQKNRHAGVTLSKNDKDTKHNTQANLAEARLGELLEGMDKSNSKLRGSSKGTTVKSTLPPGIDKKDSHYAQKLSRKNSYFSS